MTLNGISQSLFSAQPVLASFKATIAQWMNATLGIPTAQSDVHLLSGYQRRNTVTVSFRVMMASAASATQIASMSSFLSTSGSGGFVASFSSTLAARGVSVSSLTVSGVSTFGGTTSASSQSLLDQHKDKAPFVVLGLLICCCLSWIIYFIHYCCCEEVEEPNPVGAAVMHSKFSKEKNEAVEIDMASDMGETAMMGRYD